MIRAHRRGAAATEKEARRLRCLWTDAVPTPASEPGPSIAVRGVGRLRTAERLA